ncbi:MAG: D-glycerate dehydrogenase [Candidatus Melainabacteria bacterium HGW-Melainabacteria-1]|nr:MAG: D-glycerate dehydrogenase [Candidatus Melainabacteria bacterium HGW-Melainabacteria-1]
MVTRPRILISREIEAGALAQFQAYADIELGEGLSPAEIQARLPDCDAAVTMLSDRLDASAFGQLAGSKLKIVANHAVGYENLDISAAAAAGIVVCNTPDVLTQATAELAWTLLLALARRLIEGDALVRSGQWTGWAPTQLLGQSVYGRQLGIIGAGRIGQAMARMGTGFGISLVYHSRRPQLDFERTTGAKWLPLDELMATSELISMHLPGGTETHHLIDARRLGLVQPGTLLVNTGRGPTLEEAALIEALQSGPLAGAALDVYEFEPAVSQALLSLPNVVLAPHIGSATVETRRAMALRCLSNIRALLSGQPAPDALVPPSSGA